MKLLDSLRLAPNDAYGKNYRLRNKLFRSIAAVLIYLFAAVWIYFISKSVAALLMTLLGLAAFLAALYLSYTKYKKGWTDFNDASYQKSEIAQSEFEILSKMNRRQFMMRLILSPVFLIFAAILTSLTSIIILFFGIVCIGGALYIARYYYMQNKQDLENAYTIVPDPPKPPESKPNDFRDDSYETIIDRIFDRFSK